MGAMPEGLSDHPQRITTLLGYAAADGDVAACTELIAANANLRSANQPG